MGLDITAYRQLTIDPNPELDSDGYPVDYEKRFLAYPGSIRFTEENWPGHSQGVTPGAVYSFTESLRFRAGSYSGYNRWRNDLARMVGFKSNDCAWSEAGPYPFKELIDFADNEGVIGSTVATKLLSYFTAFSGQAERFAESLPAGGYWIESYRNWNKAFELAADGGAVDFH